jgi:hypothetical protein
VAREVVGPLAEVGHGWGGPPDSQASLFQEKAPLEGTVDIYWLYDDGGLTLLLPHILHTRRRFAHCRLRVFFLCSQKDELESETLAMVSLLTKFRIEADDVIIIPDATRSPRPDTQAVFDALVAGGGGEAGVGDCDGWVERLMLVVADLRGFYTRLWC